MVRLSARLTAALVLLPLIAPSGIPAQESAARPSSRDVYSLAFVDADVRRVVDAVLGSMLEADYSVDPAVTGNVTLRTRQPVPRDSLLPLLESALRSVGAVVIREGPAYRIVPRAQARGRAPVAPADGAESQVAGFASEIVPLQNAGAEEVARLVEQFLGEDAVVGTDAARNQLLIAGTAEERQAARALIARFDVDSLAGMNFELVRLENVDAGTIADELERIFQPPFDILGTRVRLVPLPRLRALLVIALNRSDIERIEPWIRRLDAGVSGRRRLHSYAVQNGRARDIARSLQLVLGSIATSDEPAPQERRRPVPRATQSEERVPIPGIDATAPEPEPAPPPPAAASEPGAQGPRIVPNDENNSLLIYANGEEYEFIREALERIDQPVAQVLIEATLAEVTLTDDLRYGVNFAGSSGDLTFGNSSMSSGTPAPIFPGFSVSVIGSTAQAVLNTLQSRTQVRVLSAPKLMVLNNQPATLQVGDQVPIVIQQAQGVSAPGAPLVNTIELRDTGVILNVTPRVNDSGTIILDIAQEVSDVTETTTSGINSPTIQQRRITTTVATRSGQMIALGGLIREGITRRRSGIPGLSQIPVIGALFGTHGTNGGRTELIILLTPTVIRSPQDVGAVVDAVIDGLDRTAPLVEQATERQASGRLPPPQ
ncbi:type II secretion system secretin GspD [Sphingosinicella terrae]|uniref:type II secretion system secretin GspD n=1 Tax=Sphingosinicella terrae TaxID=2172047 RepID=UPI0013B46F34|nr:type II secretion system secretin GspD [Sphingosinicella terrae]